GFRLARTRVVHPVPAELGPALAVRLDQDRQHRGVAADLLHRLPSHDSVLRGRGAARISSVTSVMGTRGAMAIVAAAHMAGAASWLRVAVAARSHNRDLQRVAALVVVAAQIA